MSVGFPQAVGITGMLTAAGLSDAEVHAWFQEPRRELNGMSPATLLVVRELVPGAGGLLLELAQKEAWRRRGGEDVDPEELDEIELAEADEQDERRDIERDEREADQEAGMRASIRYAVLIYHAVRASGRNPVRAGARAANVLCRELACELAGHDWSWTLATSLGTTDRPVCRRCLRAAPRAGQEQRRA